MFTRNSGSGSPAPPPSVIPDPVVLSGYDALRLPSLGLTAMWRLPCPSRPQSPHPQGSGVPRAGSVSPARAGLKAQIRRDPACPGQDLCEETPARPAVPPPVVGRASAQVAVGRLRPAATPPTSVRGAALHRLVSPACPCGPPLLLALLAPLVSSTAPLLAWTLRFCGAPCACLR